MARRAGSRAASAATAVHDVTIKQARSAFAANGLMVSDNFFSGLGVHAFLGQVFAPGDDAAARPNVVITHALWQRQFDGAPGVLGRSVSMLGHDYTVIGAQSRDIARPILGEALLLAAIGIGSGLPLVGTTCHSAPALRGGALRPGLIAYDITSVPLQCSTRSS